MAAHHSKCFALLLLSLSLFGCGGIVNDQDSPAPRATPTPAPVTAPVTITAAQVFSASIGQVWTFRNGYGDLTTITIEAPPSGNYLPAGSVVFHYRKNACRAYPAAGVCGAEYLFALSPEADGSWRSIFTGFIFPDTPPAWANGSHLWTADFQQVPGMPLPYTIIPATATTGITNSVPTDYDRWDDAGVVNFDSIISGPAAARVRWQTDSYIENVSTLVYSGPGLVSDQFESACIHEKWYFAPGLGLVKVIPLDNGSCTPGDPLLTMERIS